jgi:hypothetical protein
MIDINQCLKFEDGKYFVKFSSLEFLNLVRKNWNTDPVNEEEFKENWQHMKWLKFPSVSIITNKDAKDTYDLYSRLIHDYNYPDKFKKLIND